ncbi:phage tail tape measure protein [Salmonella enterica]|nr:phage tail tape measure protein [Salmonella enterica]
MADAKYSIAIAALDKFSAPFKSFSDTNDKLVTQIKGQQAELRNLRDAQRDLSGFERMQRKLAETSTALEQAKLDEAELARQMEATEQPTKRLTNAFEKAKNKTAQLTIEHQVQTNKLERLEQSLSEAGVDARKFASEQERIERATEQANAALKTQQTRLKSVSDAQSRVEANRAARADLRGQVLETAAMGYVAAQPIRAAINYESAMADVKKVVNFKDDTEANQMGRDILKMSTQIPMAAEGIAQIVSAAGQSGVAKAELLDFAASAAKMATAFDVSADDAGSTMAAWRASMGLSQAKAVALADATNHLSNNMNAQAKDIAGVLKRQGAVAMSAGLNEIQAASLSAALLSGGAGEEVAATALKNITGAMMKGNTGTKAQQAAWAELGFDPNQLAGDMLSDAPGTMIKVFEAMQDVPEEQVNALVSTLFGEEVKGSVMPMLKNLDNLRNAFKMTSDAAQYQGSMEAEYQARSATTANNLQLLSNKFERLQISVGTLLLPALNDIVGPIADFADYLADAAEKYPAIAKGIAMVGMGLVALKVGALAVKMVGLSFGQGINMLKLGRAKLSATTGDTARNANLANRALQRMNATMARMGRRRAPMGGAGADLGDFGGEGRGRRGRRRMRMRGGGKWGRLAGLITGGTALSLMSANANAGDLAMAGASVAGTAGDLFSALPAGGALLKGAGKMFRPLDIALSGAALTSAISNGDNQQIGATAGDMVGGLGGAAAGAAAGAAIGSVVPVIGTAIGGVIGSIVGGLGGGALGEWAGGKIGGWFGGDDEKDQVKPAQVSEMIAGNDRVNGTTDKLPTPEQVQKQVASQDNRQMVFSPSITIPPSSGNPEADQRLIDSLIERMKAELMPMMGGGELAVRLDASLSDRSNT